MPARPFKDVLLGPEQSGQAYPLTLGRGLNTWVQEGQPLQPASITEKRGCFPGGAPADPHVRLPGGLPEPPRGPAGNTCPPGCVFAARVL